jgi:hypothetical protein
LHDQPFVATLKVTIADNARNDTGAASVAIEALTAPINATGRQRSADDV